MLHAEDTPARNYSINRIATSRIETKPHSDMQEECNSMSGHEGDDMYQSAPMVLVVPVLGHFAPRMLCTAHQHDQETAHTIPMHHCRTVIGQSASHTELHQGTKHQQLDH